MNKLEERFDMYRQFIPEKYKTAFQAFLLQCAINKQGDFNGSTSTSLIYKLANEGYAPACYEYAIRVMPKCAPYDLDDYGEKTTKYYDDCQIAEKYFQMARDGGLDC